MKKISFMKKFPSYLMGIVLLTSALNFSGCSKDDDDPPVDPVVPVDLVIEPTSLSIKVDETQNINITSGNGDYQIIVDKSTIISASLSGKTITVKGLSKGNAKITVNDKEGKSQEIAVTVTKDDPGSSGDSDGVSFNTSKKYNMTVLSDEKGEGIGWTLTTTDHSNLTLISRTDFMNNVNTNVLDDDQYSSLDEYFNGYCNDPNAFIATGYDGTDLGYSAPCLLLTDKDDPDRAGMKKITILSTNIAAAMQWAGYSENLRNSWAYYDPSDGSFTMKVSGYLGWGFTFVYHRKYTPVE